MADVRSYFQGLDLDTGGGTDLVLGVNLRLSANGGAIEVIARAVEIDHLDDDQLEVLEQALIEFKDDAEQAK